MAEDPTTWAGLKTDIANWLNRDDLTSQIPIFIAYAERHFQRVIFTPDREEALSITADAQSEALPSDFWGFKSGPYVDGATDVILTRLEPGDLRRTYPDATTGTPSHYAIEGENILFGPTPSSSLTIKGTYYKTIPVLNASTATNWLLTDHPDVYLAGALFEASLYVIDDTRAAIWKTRRDEGIELINRVARKREANSGPLTRTHSYRAIRNIQA